jgi:NTE family protein
MDRLARTSVPLDKAGSQSHDKSGVALCLSGRGYSAMLFQAGCLWRLNELGWLSRIHCVSSVSAAAITAGVLALSWRALEFDRRGIARNFVKHVIEPIRRIAGQTVEDWSVIGAAYSSYSPGEIIANALDEYLFAGATLQAVPAQGDGGAPHFVFSASNIVSGSLFSFSRSRIWDSRGGIIVAQPNLRLALAIAASTSRAPWLSTTVTLNESGCGVNTISDSTEGSSRPLTLELTDGGMLDSFGVEAVWDSYRVFLVSDGGSGVPREPEPCVDFAPNTARMVDILADRLRLARRRELFNTMTAPPNNSDRIATYWDITAGCPDRKRSAPPYPRTPKPHGIAEEPALRAIRACQQDDLINRGHAAVMACCGDGLKNRANSLGDLHIRTSSVERCTE